MSTVTDTGEQEARIGFRTTARHKRLFERAAQLRGLNLTAFVLEALDKASRETIQEFETMVLDEADREAFVAALLNPPEPNEHLRQSARVHDALLGGG